MSLKTKFINWAVDRFSSTGRWCEDAAERLHDKLPRPPSTMTEAERKLWGGLVREMASSSPYIDLLQSSTYEVK
jgi:hypothetical protein